MTHQRLHPLWAEPLLDEQARRGVAEGVQPVFWLSRGGADPGCHLGRAAVAAVQVRQRFDIPLTVREDEIEVTPGTRQFPFPERVDDHWHQRDLALRGPRF